MKSLHSFRLYRGSALLLLSACWATSLSAAALHPAAAERSCEKASCLALPSQSDPAAFVFGLTDRARQDPHNTGADRAHQKSTFGWSRRDADKHAHPGRGRDWVGGRPGFIPDAIPPGRDADVIACPTDPVITPQPAAVVPVPAAAWLFLSGILGLGMAARRRK